MGDLIVNHAISYNSEKYLDLVIDQPDVKKPQNDWQYFVDENQNRDTYSCCPTGNRVEDKGAIIYVCHTLYQIVKCDIISVGKIFDMVICNG